MTKQMLSPSVILIFLLCLNALGQNDSKDLLNRKISSNFEAENLIQICSSLAVVEKIPLGCEATSNFDFNEVKKIQIKSATLREVLDSLIKQLPEYTWEVQNGVVNIYPIWSRDGAIKALIETKIKNFSSKKGLGRQGIARIIEGLDEVNIILKAKKIKLDIATSSNRFIKDVTAEIELSDTSLQGILNKVVYDSEDSKCWTIVRNNTGEIFLQF